MKSKKLWLVTLTAGALIGGTLQSNAQINFHVDPGQTWFGYINAFELDNTTFATGFPETIFSTASANWAPGPAQPLTMSPNTRLYDDVILDPFWVDQGTFEANKIVEFNYYQEVTGTIGDIVTFDFSTIANTLPVGYEARGFIKVLDGNASWATTQYEFADLGTLGDQSVSFVVADAGAGTEIVQAGFSLRGLAVSASDPISLTGVQIVPEPTTFALAGLGAAALLIFRRRR